MNFNTTEPKAVQNSTDRARYDFNSVDSTVKPQIKQIFYETHVLPGSIFKPNKTINIIHVLTITV